MPEFFDSHCHIHEAVPHDTDDLVQNKWQQAGFVSPDPLIEEAVSIGVKTLLCIGCTTEDSRRAIALANQNEHCFASIGIHPHEAKNNRDQQALEDFAQLAKEKRVVAIGECGLDYFYKNSPKQEQIELLEFQLDVAQRHSLPVVFHVREAYEDFWPIVSNFSRLRGVLHSYTDNLQNLDKALSHGFNIGLNGIMTFTKDTSQLEVAKAVPLSKLLLETDAPFLTPAPYRGKICKPKHVVVTAVFLSDLRGETLEDLAAATTHNAKELFGLV